ncbi:MAG: methyltransferase domain containing protein [archaeon]|nr:methyltransferase domain containing protein [archaeon]
MSVFEYGSGGSTIFFSKKVGLVISVEHDKYWHRLVSNEIAKENIPNCRLLLREPEQGIFDKTDPSDPESYLSSSPKYCGMNFKSYATSIGEFPDNFFDLVFIDGRARTSCIANALAKVRSGGYLMLDNSDREHYYQGKNLLRGWSIKRFYGVGPYETCSWETTIWRKP